MKASASKTPSPAPPPGVQEPLPEATHTYGMQPIPQSGLSTTAVKHWTLGMRMALSRMGEGRARPAGFRVSTGRELASSWISPTSRFNRAMQGLKANPEDVIYLHTGCKAQASAYSEFS